jgi:cob(I)alamin adenosyltransferase
MQKLYTKTGDKGESSLLNGERLSKRSLVFEVLGTLDEFNAHLGLLLTLFPAFKGELQNNDHKKMATSQQEFLLRLQNELFNIGAEVAGSPRPLLQPGFLLALEKQIDAIQDLMAKTWRQRFVLPGASPIAAEIDVARTVCRRAERLLAALDAERDIRESLLKVMNRSSDYLYALRNFCNWSLGVEEIEYRAPKK